MTDIELAFLCIGVLIASILIGLAVDKYVNQGRILASIYQIFHKETQNTVVHKETQNAVVHKETQNAVVHKETKVYVFKQNQHKSHDYEFLKDKQNVIFFEWDIQRVDNSLRRLYDAIIGNLTNNEDVYLIGNGQDGWFSIVAAQYIIENYVINYYLPRIRVMAIDPVVTENCMNGQVPLLGNYADHYNFHVYTSSDNDSIVKQCYGKVASVHPMDHIENFFAQFENKNER